MGRTRGHRLENALGMQLRDKATKRRVKAKPREDRREALAANETCAMDVVHDQRATGRKPRLLTIVDIWSHFAPTVDARFSDRADNVVETLDRICAGVGWPKTIRVGQRVERLPRPRPLGPPARHHAGLLPARPGEPTDTAFERGHIEGRVMRFGPLSAKPPRSRPSRRRTVVQVLLSAWR